MIKVGDDISGLGAVQDIRHVIQDPHARRRAALAAGARLRLGDVDCAGRPNTYIGNPAQPRARLDTLAILGSAHSPRRSQPILFTSDTNISTQYAEDEILRVFNRPRTELPLVMLAARRTSFHGRAVTIGRGSGV
jgi:hypothetical protein